MLLVTMATGFRYPLGRERGIIIFSVPCSALGSLGKVNQAYKAWSCLKRDELKPTLELCRSAELRHA